MELKYLLNCINSSHHNVEEYYNFLFPILYYNNEVFIKSDFLNSTIKCSYKNNYNKTNITKKEKYDYNLNEKYNYNLDKEYNFLFNKQFFKNKPLNFLDNIIYCFGNEATLSLNKSRLTSLQSL